MEVDLEASVPSSISSSSSSSSLTNPDIAQYCRTLTDVATDYQKMFVDMYRSFYPALFESLVKLQLSFLVDLSVDLFLAGPDDDLEVACSRHSSPLRRLLRSHSSGRECEPEGCPPPHPIESHRLLGFRHLLAYLKRPHILRTPFIFRVPGRAARVKELRQMLLSGEGHVERSGNYSPHDIASALKTSLCSLEPESLLTARYSVIYAKVAALASPQPDDRGVRHPLDPNDRQLRASKQLKALRLLLLLLPEANCALFTQILELLKSVCETPGSGMNAEALGIIFGPVFFPPESFRPGIPSCNAELERRCLETNRLVTVMIESYPSIKEIPASIVTAISTILDAHNDPTEAPATVAYARRRHTGQEVARSYTEYAISELYAHVAMWPESSRKRRFIRKLSRRQGGLDGAALRVQAARELTRRDSRKRLRPRGPNQRVVNEEDASCNL